MAEDTGAETALGGEPGGQEGTALGGEAPAEGAASAVPETYEDFAVEGVELTEAQQTRFKELAKAGEFSQDGASRAVSMHLELERERIEAATAEWDGQVSSWLSESKSDKEFGGESYNASIKVALKAIDKFGTPELKQMLNQYGIGNHPELIRFAYRIGQALKDDSVETGQSGASGERTWEAAAQMMYNKSGRR